MRPGVEIEVRREPVGVVAIITPWNFPMATAAWKIAPALAFGNAVVFKPANAVPASAWALTEIIARQPCPQAPSTWSWAAAPGRGAADPVGGDPGAELHGLGRDRRRVAAATAANFVRCQLEMGSKNALVVLDDADLPLAVECAVNGAFFGTGQKCTASSRLIVTEGIHDRYVQALVERIGQLKVGHPLREGVHIGPVIDEGQLARNLRYIELARAEGARLACGGERIEDERPGYYMRPALFVDTRNDMRINRDEVFGPIACVIKARDYEDALTMLNDTRFGLTAGIVTRSLRHAISSGAPAPAASWSTCPPPAPTITCRSAAVAIPASAPGSRGSTPAISTAVKTVYIRP